ncbi:hypothetical protein BCR35DRAFT_181316 [Leucosporidium creatinivorum]|uniref:Multiprotein bridging factor 1 N-terminal domain-containing protein n=1 Tax=Leucosporidium creatinivorum TaxID=106004 RepID=A0A1Y2E665_9BASI|nr:hypothetical protein BCR35DRAFT_181316 [Leucosporidium creatinivorum]
MTDSRLDFDLATTRRTSRTSQRLPLSLTPATSLLDCTSTPHATGLYYTTATMAGSITDWDSKTVIGQKARGPTVTRDGAALNAARRSGASIETDKKSEFIDGRESVGREGDAQEGEGSREGAIRTSVACSSLGERGADDACRFETAPLILAPSRRRQRRPSAEWSWETEAASLCSLFARRAEGL